MSAPGAYLVVGGDSLVGGGLMRALERRGKPAFASTRRKDTLAPRRIFLDFESDDPPRVPPEVGYAFLVAAATNYERCERDPLARRINAELIPGVVGALLSQGIFVTFISTNAVFGGERPWPDEDDPQAPGIAYAHQKAEAEKSIRDAARRVGAQARLNIVRLTKILDRTTAPLPAWLAAWQRGECVEPFRDLVFAPMSVQFAGEALATIGERRIPGNLHLSGADNVSYVKFADALARRLGVDANLIAPSSAREKGVHIAFMPRYSGLGMRRTSELSGLKPQSLAAVIEDLVADPSTETGRKA